MENEKVKTIISLVVSALLIVSVWLAWGGNYKAAHGVDSILIVLVMVFGEPGIIEGVRSWRQGRNKG